jgi:hypothetical protein
MTNDMTKLERTMEARMPKQMSILRFEFRVSSFFRSRDCGIIRASSFDRKLSTLATVSIRAGVHRESVWSNGDFAGPAIKRRVVQTAESLRQLSQSTVCT